MNSKRLWRAHLALIWAAASQTFGADVPKAPVPQSPFIRVVYGYADAMLKNGRDDRGPVQTGLFLSALDRSALAPLTNRPPAPQGIRSNDRVGINSEALVGANPQHDENLLRLLYTLSELSGKPHYRAAADAELKWFFENSHSTNTDVLPWGEGRSWDVMNDRPAAAAGAAARAHAFFRPWMLWERCFELAPEASRRFALGLWRQQTADPKTKVNGGAVHGSLEAADVTEFPRQAGFYLRTWAAAYAQTKENVFLEAMETLLTRYEKTRDTRSHLSESDPVGTNEWTTSALSLAIDCDGAAQSVPEPLASRLQAVAEREDGIFCALAHDLKETGGFLTGISKATDKTGGRRTPLWQGGYGRSTTAQVGMMCVSRYDNTGRVGYRDLIYRAADAYLDSLPSEGEDAWPATFGHALSLQIAAWRHSARPVYFERARKLGDVAVEKFWGTNALPSASLKTDHYETITGADTLALALLELHLNILHITAVRCPANTIDR